MKPHKHADVLHAIADGKEVQWKNRVTGEWFDDASCSLTPLTHDYLEWRVKPEPKPEDVVVYAWLPSRGSSVKIPSTPSVLPVMNLKITYDGETGEPKAVELIKGEQK